GLALKCRPKPDSSPTVKPCPPRYLEDEDSALTFKRAFWFLGAIAINQTADHGEKPGHRLGFVEEGVDVPHRFGRASGIQKDGHIGLTLLELTGEVGCGRAL